jgi:phosphatidylethanolamine/phosphatidyl-N-methylethanolamine N-methyltransferase
MSDTLLFLRELATKPLQISAIAPSSRFLAKAMTRDIGPQTGRVVEFGPGTGVLTRGILQAGVKPTDLTLFEMSAEFSGHLRAAFPGVTVQNTGAQNAPLHVETGVGAVISGLPLMSMPLEVRESIVRAAFEILAPDGIYVQFTYGSKAQVTPEQMAKLGLRVEQTAYVLFNLPPARVHTFRRA